MGVTTSMESTPSRAADGVDIVVGQPAEHDHVSNNMELLELLELLELVEFIGIGFEIQIRTECLNAQGYRC
jgi:hypothetical protein